MIVYDTNHDRLDLAELAALLAAVGWADLAKDPERLAAAVRGSRWVVSAWDGEKLVGFCRAYSDGAFAAYLTNVAVLPEYQRRGIGGELVRRLLAGHDAISFDLHADAAVQAFYAKLGFVPRADMFRRPRSS